MPSFRIDRVSLEYQWWGAVSDRPPVLLVHDALGSVKGWGDWPQVLSTTLGCRVFAWSRQGHGESEPLTDPLPVDYVQQEALERLPRVREALKLESEIVLVGLHDGAAMALAHAGGGTQPVRAVAAITPLLQVDEVTRSAIWTLSTHANTALKETASDQVRTLSEWAQLWTSPAFAQWNIDDFLRGVTCPVLAARGDKDAFTSPTHVKRLERLLRDAHVVPLAGCRHMPHLDKPALLAETIAAFLRLYS